VPSKRPTRLLLAAFVLAVAAGGTAAGILVARSGAGSTPAEGRHGVLARGTFEPVGWSTTGTAAIVRETSGLKLRLGGNFRTQPAPELFVYLARYDGERRTEWKEVGPLRRAWGTQEYELPAEAAKRLHVTVAIYCGKCNRIFGSARLAPARTAVRSSPAAS
jgi:Electron transfer DM13